APRVQRAAGGERAARPAPLPAHPPPRRPRTHRAHRARAHGAPGRSGGTPPARRRVKTTPPDVAAARPRELDHTPDLVDLAGRARRGGLDAMLFVRPMPDAPA